MAAPTMAQREIERRLTQIYNVLQQVSALDTLANVDAPPGSWFPPRVVVDELTFKKFKANIDKAKIHYDGTDYLTIDAGQNRVVVLAIYGEAQED